MLNRGRPATISRHEVLAGFNLLGFYATGVARTVENLGPGEDASSIAKKFAGASLFLWIAVMYFGRLVPWGQFTP